MRSDMTAFAVYRLPHQQQVTLVSQTTGKPQEQPSCEALNDQQGFVMAPFSISDNTPLLLIRPDEVRTFACGDMSMLRSDLEFAASKLPPSYVQTLSLLRPNSEQACYAADFTRFHASLKSGRFSKLVLSRCSISILPPSPTSPLDLFQRACTMYPRLFVALVYTPQSGLWLTATPEILLEGDGCRWRTIALAGTMKLKDNELQGEGEHLTWSTKNIQEQRFVATYLRSCLEHFASDIREEGPRTVRAANLVHLRSDFTFTLFNNARVGTLLQALHPTPAVCGLPKEEAFRFILDNEHTPRQYYSGFMGPLNLITPSTHLYVSLRCMQITATHYHLYAGGGLLKDSVEEQEWQETEAKLETMRQCIATKKI